MESETCTDPPRSLPEISVNGISDQDAESSASTTPSMDKNGFPEEFILNSSSSTTISRQHSTNSSGHSIETNSTVGQDQFRNSNSSTSISSHLEEAIGFKVERIANSRLLNSTGLMTNGSLRSPGQLLEHQLVSDVDTQQVRNRAERDRIYAIERTNLVNLLKLVNKALIESCINSNRMIDYDQNDILHHFFHVLEQIFKHSLKSKKGLLFGKKELWNLVESLESFIASSRDLINSVRELPHIKTNIGRARAFIRLAFVQKFLPDYFRFIIERKDILNKFYEPQSIMMNEEAVQIHGILIGLSIVDCNWCAKDEDLDNLSLTIELTPYLRILKNLDDVPSPTEPDDKPVLQKVLDQKNYVEELNKQLNSKVNVLSERIKELEGNKEEPNALTPFNIKEALTQIFGESTLKFGSSGDNKMTPNELLTKILEEDPTFLQGLLDVKEELARELQQKVERETAMAAMEKDIHEKQDTIVSIRKQLEDIKTINIQLYNKLKECEQTLKGKMEQISLLEQKNSVMEATLLQYETKLVASESKYCALAESHKRTCEQFVELGNAKSKLDQNLERETIEREKAQTDNRKLEDNCRKLQQELKEIKETNFDFEKLRKEYLGLQKRCSDYELTMEELGIKLQITKLETEQLKETNVSKDAIWTPDEEATNCFSCAKPFTVARRRHHCRNCGHIFCGPCSDNKLPLPSSSKPCRVCDQCHVLLLERYSAS